MDKLISLVSYLNSKPFAFGIAGSTLQDCIVTSDTPAICADKLITGKADIGLVPVAVIPLINNAEIISDYCISAEGKVNSVLLVSQVPLQDIKLIILDNQSRTSVMLARILANNHWHISPQWITENTEADFSTIRNDTAAVIIGDRALKMKSQFKYCYDLSEEWQKMTGLPFVFACWISNKKIEQSFIEDFNNALKKGVDSIDDLAKAESLSEEEIFYLKNFIQYTLNDQKRNAVKLFLSMMNDIKKDSRNSVFS